MILDLDFIVQKCKEYYSIPENGVGGSLHIVLDDENIEDENIIWCRDFAKAKGDILGVQLCEYLIQMPIELRQELVENHYQRYSSL